MWRLEDAQFDMLIGKEPQDQRFKFLNSKQPISELQILQNNQMQIPFKTKESPDISDKMNALSLQEAFNLSDRYLHFVVEESRRPPIAEAPQATCMKCHQPRGIDGNCKCDNKGKGQSTVKPVGPKNR